MAQSGTLTDVGGGGNTDAPTTKNACCNWVFTLKADSVTPEEVLAKCVPECAKVKFSLEMGEGGYRHYQGMMALKRKQRMTGIKSWLGREVHLEVMRDEQASLAYCEKEDSHLEGPWGYGYPRVRKPKPVPAEWRPWQTDILRLVENDPDERTVVWVVDRKGRSGKTTLARHICLTWNGICVAGKIGDVLYAATESNADVFVVNAARDTSEFPYEAIEQLKDGMWFSGKYESKSKILDYNVHVLVFANREPEYRKLTFDRWVVYNLIEGNLIRTGEDGVPSVPPRS